MPLVIRGLGAVPLWVGQGSAGWWVGAVDGFPFTRLSLTTATGQWCAKPFASFTADHSYEIS